MTELNDIDLAMRRYAAVLDELRRLGLRGNNIVGEYAENLAARRLLLNLAPMSAKGFDAIDEEGTRYQVKARRRDTTLGVIRNLNSAERTFDSLLAIIFHDDFSVETACKIPYVTVRNYAREKAYEGGYVLSLTQKILKDPAVIDLTHVFR
jgi:hypothetical protein